MILASFLTGLGHMMTGLGMGFLIPVIVVLIANLLLLGLLFALGMMGMAWFVHGLLHEAALYIWRKLLPASYAEDFAFDDKARRTIISIGTGVGLLATLSVR